VERVRHLPPREQSDAVTTAGSPVTPASAGAAIGTVPESVGSPVPEKSIAVLPFDDMSEKKDQEYFADGLAEEILNALSQVPELRVAARTSTFSLKGKNLSVADVAERLHVATVLEGSVRRAGDRVRITAQLIDANSGFHLWSERYDRHLADIFEIQDDIAHSIASRFKVRLLAEDTRPTANVEAYELYIRGRYEWHQRTPTTMQAALRYFEESSHLDPSNALAFTGLADCYAILTCYGWIAACAARDPAFAAMQRAVALAPDLWETSYTQGLHIFTFDRTWRNAQPFFERAVAINPRSALAQAWLALFLATAGERARVITHAALAQQIDPLSPFSHYLAALALSISPELDAAEQAARRALDLRPDYQAALWVLGKALCRAGRAAEAIPYFERLVELSRAPFNLAWLAWGLGIAGRHDEARRLATELEERGGRGEFTPPIAKLLIATGLGDLAGVRAALAAGVEFWTPPEAIVHCDLKPFLGDPEVAKLYQAYGL
jgi:adenylate cyclase